MKTLLNLFISLTFSTLFAQLNPNTKWGKVNQNEIDYKEVSFEKEAPAVILYEEGKSTINGTITTMVYRRIKILKESGIEAANQELMYYAHKRRESITNIKAQTINIENGQTLTYPVDKNAFFDVTVNEYYSSKKFAFPNIKVGSIIEFEYQITDQNLYLIDAWRFQHEYPTIYSSYTIKNEMRLDYTSLMIGEKIVQFSKNKKDLNAWAITNIPSYNSLEFIYNPKDVSERIVFQLRGYMKGGTNGYDSAGYQDVLSNWKELNKEMEDQYAGAKSQAVGKEIAASIPNGKNELETLNNVYNYFKQNFRWNKFYSIYCKQTNRDVQKSGSGNAAELNLLLNSVLKAKGFHAELILIGTRDYGKIITSYPYLGQFNVVLNLVDLADGSNFLIDASDLTYDLGYLPLRDFNHYGLVVDSKSEKFITLNPLISEFHLVQNYIFKEGKFQINRVEKRNGYFKEKLEGLPKNSSGSLKQLDALDIFLNEKKRDFKNSDENNFEMERIISESVPLGDAGFILVENPLKPIVNQYKLKETTRERALEFNFPLYYKTDVVIDIPDGFHAEIPQNFNSHHKNQANDLIYLQNAEVKNGKLIVHVEFYIKKVAYLNNYPEIKSILDNAIADATKSILIKKN